VPSLQVAPPRFRVSDVWKSFGTAHALRGASVTVQPGTVHALVGENGAGKSTLGKVLAGVHQPDSGDVLLDGRPVTYHSPRDAMQDGIAIVAQELALVPQLTVVANVFLGTERRHRWLRRDSDRERRRYRELAEEVGFEIPSDRTVGDLKLADQQKVEILRALARDSRVIIMDEPTAALGASDTERLMRTIRMLRDRGVTIIYVSHFLNEVLAIADDVTVMRDGAVVDTRPASEHTTETMIESMLGRSFSATFPERNDERSDSVVLEVRDLCRDDAVRGVSFDLREGEILGISGLVGSGRSELARAIVGVDQRTAGTVSVDGRPLAPGSVRRALKAGVVLVPESRKAQGLVMSASVRLNVTLPHLLAVTRAGLVRRQVEREQVSDICQAVTVTPPDINKRVEHLSGGNQQKALFAKWLFRSPRVLIVDEPTRGVDIAAKHALYALVGRLAKQGMAIVLISSEVEEVLGLADRILVMHRGRVSRELDGRTATEDELMRAAVTDGGTLS